MLRKWWGNRSENTKTFAVVSVAAFTFLMTLAGIFIAFGAGLWPVGLLLIALLIAALAGLMAVLDLLEVLVS